MQLVPPMAEEPPPEYVAFVITRLGGLRREASRLTGGDPDGTHLYMDALADVAGHWRRLTLLGRLGRTFARDHTPADPPCAYLARRLDRRTRRWREDQVYEVDVRVLHERPAYVYTPPTAGSIALQKATLLPGTVRTTTGPLADAGIAWVQAYRRAFVRRVIRTFALTILTIAGTIEFLTWLSGGSL